MISDANHSLMFSIFGSKISRSKGRLKSNFEPGYTVFIFLQHEGDKCLNLKNLGSFFHYHIIVLERQRNQLSKKSLSQYSLGKKDGKNLSSLQSGMGASHGNYFCFLGQQIIRAVVATSQQLKGSHFLELGEDICQMTLIAATGNFSRFVKRNVFWEQRLGCCREKLMEGEEMGNILSRGCFFYFRYSF